MDTKNQLWCSIIADSHDSVCGCELPFAHLLSSIFPPGHTDRDKTINQILERDYKQLCHSGGKGDADPGLADGLEEPKEESSQRNEGDSLEDVNIDALIAAAEENTR